MNFNQFVVRNTLRNGRLYLAYFLSTMFSVMIFFTFTTMALHPSLAEGLNKNVQVGMTVAAVIIYGFAFFFVMYSMDVFLQSRKKEFGTLMIQGMSPKQLRRMVFIENLVIGFFATIVGVFVGLGFSQFILWIAKFAMGVSFAFYFPAKAILVTVASFIVLFLVISFFIQFKLPKLNLQDLLKADQLGKGGIKVSKVKALLAVAMIAAGYVIALLAEKTLIIFVFFPVAFLVILGTKLLFDQFSVMVINNLRKNQNVFWKKTNMVVFSDLAFRMKDNARSFFLVAVISTVAFSAIGTLFGFRNMIYSGMDAMPYDFGAADLKESDAKHVDDILAKYGIDAERTTYTSYYDSEYALISEADFNKQAKLMGNQTVSLDGDAVQIMSSVEASADGHKEKASVKVNGKEYKVKEHLADEGLSVSQPTFVIPNGIEPTDMSKFSRTIWMTKDAKKADLIKVGPEMEKFQVNAKAYTDNMITTLYAPVLFVGLFVGIVFFVSAGSFLYFRLYSDMNNDVEKFRMIHKLGLSKKELKKMIYQQIGILFFTPIIVSLIHGVVALTTMYHAFNTGMQTTAWLVLAAFLVIQVIYYLICRTFYFRRVYEEITA